MTEEQLRIKKLELDVKELARSHWKKPQYLTTTIVSVLTILVTAAIGFDRYFQNVDQNRANEIEALQKIIEDDKQSKHELENARQKLENTKLRLENEEAQQTKADIEKQILEARLSLKRTLDKYKMLTPEHGKRLINSASGQAEVKRIIDLGDPEEQRLAISKFAFGIMNQTYSEISKEMNEELGVY